ncbi:hypothetical protein PHAVU_005G111900 [Phaseolus vulgaris]|uniref:Uncharacterized protein n=1 Tax=Phaseolus vulgaris TaxID=3885 RepID=V7BXZ2_PHAVU|nr:hypothetical protein PHAVU_005G111900g [Phaseolus vulgaris]ESW21933.1 hypothetical protein PHAVU_005G111900g [Phaseolus vulgaris]
MQYCTVVINKFNFSSQYNNNTFVFFVDTMKVMQSSDPLGFLNLTQTLEFSYQALANGVTQHAKLRLRRKS